MAAIFVHKLQMMPFINGIYALPKYPSIRAKNGLEFRRSRRRWFTKSVGPRPEMIVVSVYDDILLSSILVGVVDRTVA
jgi:hypothetical protein